MSIFTIGDEVTWTSQSAGITKTKTGVVVAVVYPGEPVNHALEHAHIRGRIKNPGSARHDRQSYVVRAGGRLYWPRVNQLSKVVLHEPTGR